MSEDALHGFLGKLSQDKPLREEAARAVAAIAATHGFECTLEECERFFTVPPEVADGALSDDVLAAVAGGAGSQVIGHSISVAFSQQSDGLGRKLTGR